jgi:hypothetical protein
MTRQFASVNSLTADRDGLDCYAGCALSYADSISRVLKEASCRLLKKIQVRGGIVVIVSVQTRS